MSGSDREFSYCRFTRENSAQSTKPGTNHYRHPTQCRKPDRPVCFSYSRRLSRQTLRHPNINFELSEFSPFGSLSLAQKLGFNSKHTNNKAMQSNDESITMA